MLPFIKWAGGKRRFTKFLQVLFHPSRRLVDLTVGAGAIPLGLLPDRVLVNDVNPHVINLFRQVQQGFDLDGFDPVNTEDAYLHYRFEFNGLIQTEKIEGKRPAQLFYYLLKHGFNGLCRFAKVSQTFNTPYGKYKQVNLLQSEGWAEYQRAIAHWQFCCGDFADVPVEPGDFVFADPPYDSVKEGKTGKGFSAYSRPFSWGDQVRLAECLAAHPGPVIAFNAETLRIVQLYQDLGFDVLSHKERRSISCNGDRRLAATVLITKNFVMPFQSTGS